MSSGFKGELVPLGGGDAVPLIRPLLTLGRRSSCDVCMRFPNISGLHCELSYRDGYWYVRDLNSTNGIKVNGIRVQEKVLLPQDEVTIGKRKYRIEYVLPADRRAPVEEDSPNIMGQSLLEKAGLEKRTKNAAPARSKVSPADLARLFGSAPDNDDDNTDDD
jgi:pSer/pThr/pTyr-binding forkhead associated (FHA) protein